MILYNESPEVYSAIAMCTHIDGYKMVQDLHLLTGLSVRDPPLHINRQWHPKVEPIYAQYLSKEREVSAGERIPRSIYDTDFFVYELDPIDDWTGYYQLFMEDLLQERKWMNLIHHTFTILKECSNWEQDVMSGPFISMLPGMEIGFSHWVVLVKQENNGDTYVVSRYPLEYLTESLVKCHIAKKVGKS